MTPQTSAETGFPFRSDRLDALIEQLLDVRRHILDYENQLATRIRQVHPAYSVSARNLIHYLALRQLDVRPIQSQLVELGLSSLGSSHGHVMANLDHVIALLQAVRGNSPPTRPLEPFVTFEQSRKLIERHTEALLGGGDRRRRVRIMVTLPEEAAGDASLTRDLLAAGMDCARINCAHDDASVWLQLVRSVDTAQRQIGRPCRILMDLAGPKLRTGEVKAGPAVVRWRPQRDELGRVVEPARIWLTPAEAPQAPPVPATVLPVTGKWLRTVRVADEIALRDARGRRRVLVVTGTDGQNRWCTCDRTAYVTPGTLLRLAGTRRRNRSGPSAGIVGDLPERPGRLRLRRDDLLVITADGLPGEDAEIDADGSVRQPAHISCTLPQVLADVRPGEHVWFDDGRIGGVIEEASPEAVVVRIVHAAADGSRLAADKGINLPDSDLSVRGLTDADIAHLDFVARYADSVAMSFLRTAEDVAQLQNELRRHGGTNLGVILKIETRRAVQELPSILLTAMRTYPIGVMIARGDLAIELGFDRLAVAQEEILSMCEAAHLPVIWATQVLESLTKQGLPSRAELTDAATSVRADCVMLNRGPYLVEAIRVLDQILLQASEHHRKASTLLAPLSVSPADPAAVGSAPPTLAATPRPGLTIQVADEEAEE